MAGSDERFSKLRRSAKSPTARHDDSTADLFEHFGVDLGVGEPELAVGPAVEAAACHRCGWYLPYRRSQRACPACHETDPIRPAAGSPS